MTLLLALLGLLYFILPVVSFVLALLQRSRVERLERELRDLRAQLGVQQGAGEAAAPLAPPPVTQPPLAPSPANQPLPDTATPTQAAPPAPSEPSPAWLWLTGFFSGSGAFARVGAVLLLIGLGLGLKYAGDAGLIGPPLRLLAALLVAGALFAVGWRLRVSQRPFALALQGTAFGILYLTVYAAWQFSALLPNGVGLGLLVALGVGMGALALRQEAQLLAWLGILGGFLAPLLNGGGEGPPALLWAYYLLLNAAVCALAWWRDWRALYGLGFVSTFVVAVGWGLLSGGAGQRGAVEPFLILISLLYFAVPLIEARRGRPTGGFVQALLLFGTPAAFLGLQSALLDFARRPLALSALGVAALYGLAAFWLGRQTSAPRLLRRGHLAVALFALTLAVPLALNWEVTVGVWALEGAALAWYAGRGRSPGWALAGLAVQGVALFVWGLLWLLADRGTLPSVAVNALLMGLAGVLSGLALQGLGRGWSGVPGLSGVLMWLLGGVIYALDRVPQGGDALALLWVSITAMLAALLAGRWPLDALRWAALAPPPATALLLLARAGDASPFAALGWLGFGGGLVGGWLAADLARSRLTPAAHTLLSWLGLTVLSWWAASLLARLGDPWPALAWALVPLVGLALATRLAARNPAQGAGWRQTWLPVTGWLLLWALFHLGLPGEFAPLPYLPLLNPADLTLLLALFAGWATLTRSGAAHTPGLPEMLAPFWARLPARLLPRLLGALGVAAFTGLLLRAVSHYADLPWTPGDLAASGAAQTTVTLGWASLGILGMSWATRRGVREVWLIGAGLLALVTLKLFLIDLSGVSPAARVVSFLGAGGLFLLVGYLSPAPPQEGPGRQAQP